MGKLVDQFGRKSPGQLIQSQHWNSMVEAVEQNDEALRQRIDKLSDSFDVLADTVNKNLIDLTEIVRAFREQIVALQDESVALQRRVQRVFKGNYRVSLETSKVNYALGEMALITARLADLEGNPVDFKTRTERPWIDFLSSWGRLKPVRGAESLGSIGDRTLSVKVNEVGVASVFLRAEYSEDFTEDVEQQMEAALQTRLQSNGKTIADTVVAAKTPREAKDTGAFQKIIQEYDRPDVFSVRSYVNTYFRKSTLASAVKLKSLPGQRDFQATWRDHRSTVLAFAKHDSDPHTPDPGLGVSSIQVTFRDWIGPWITLGYFEKNDRQLQDIQDRLSSKVTRDLRGSIDLIKQEVNNIVKERGVVGAHRDYMLIHEAMDKLKAPEGARVEFDVPTLAKYVKQGVSLQRSLLTAQGSSDITADEDNAFAVITDAATRVNTGTASIKTEIEAIRGRVVKADENFGAIKNQMAALQTSVATVQNLNSKVTTMESKVNRFSEINVAELRAGLANAGAVRNAVNLLLKRERP